MKESKIEILPIDAGLNPEALLSDYYQSLNCYHPAKDTESVEAPLWQLRLLHLQQQYHLTEQLKEAAETCQKPELRLLLNLTYLAAKEVDNSSKCFSFSSLSPEEKIQLLNMADADNSLRQPYAISLLMTLFLRDSNKQYRQIGLKLLKKGKYNDDSFEIGNSQPLKVNLKLSSHTDLCRSPFIDFSYSNFMALGEIKINLSGQYLKGIKAERVIFSAVHGGHFRFACLEEAVLIHAIIKKCDFTGAVLWAADFSHANLKESIFNQVNADQINLISAKAKGSQWEQTNLYGAKLDAANLTQANLHRSDITGVVFEQSILKKTVLTEVTGLNAVSLQKAEQFEKWYPYGELHIVS